MRTRYYRLTVVACVLSWFLIGLHLPALHQMTHLAQAPHTTLVVVTALLTLVAVGGLWALLRAPSAGAPGSGRG